MDRGRPADRQALSCDMVADELLAPADTGDVRRLAPDLWRIVAPNPSPLTGPGTNTYVLGRGRCIVIDPGPADEGHLGRILGAAGGEVAHIVCTHSHEDHSPGAAVLRKLTGATVHGRHAPDDAYQDPGYAPDHAPEDGETLEAGGVTLKFLHTPGHASNHVCPLLEDRELLFTGDHLMNGSTVVILPPDGSMRQYLASLRRLRSVPLQALAPGHGSVMPDAHAEIDRVIAHRLAREGRVVAALQARVSATLEEILPVVYADVPVALHPLARQSLLAHAIKLEEEGRARREGEAWVWLG
jgi:glyoxylase-like metal-dependent hydrolase (beta-lactamase superfamily II)